MNQKSSSPGAAFAGCRTHLLALLICLGAGTASAVIRDGGIDPANLGKGDWIYAIQDATNRLSGHVSSVTNENSLMLFYMSVGVRYVMVKTGTGASLYNACYGFPQLTPYFCSVARSNGIWVFGYNRSYGTNTAGEVAIANFVFNQGADGFVWDAEAEWESAKLGTQGPALAWAQCSQVRSNWPTKFLAHAPFPIISYHSSFPYNEFGYWCDAVMPQIYHSGWTGVKGTASGGINWCDANFSRWQNSLVGSNSLINGQTIWWTNAIKPIAPVENVYGELNAGLCNGPASVQNPKDVMEFVDYLNADPNCPSPGGTFNGANFWRADLHGVVQWQNIAAGTAGPFPGKVNNIVIDDPRTITGGPWTPIRTFSNGGFTGSGSGTDTNSFGTNYMVAAQGTGSTYAQFTPAVVVPGDYNVYQWHVYRPDASAGAPHVVNYYGGSTTVYANQQTNDGNWSLLGRFNFAAGNSGNVRVTDATTDGGIAIVDGLKLVFVPPTAVPATPSNLVAAAASTVQIDLAWKDNATNETGFVISRSTNSGGPFGDAGSVAGGITNFSDTGLTADTTYYYKVRATNWLGASVGSAAASATTAGTPTAPSITSQPQSQTVIAGQDATFSVSATGGSLGFQWWFGNAPIDGANASTFTRASVRLADAGDYTVVITNLLGSTSSAPATLTVNYGLATAVNGNGSIAKNPNQASYSPNAIVSLTATPGAGSAFVGWSGDASGAANPLSVQVTTNLSVTANFVSTDIVLDNTNAAVSFIGAWQTGTASTDKAGADYRFASTVPGGQSNAVYRPNIAIAGLYDVFIWYPQGGNRAVNAPWSITCYSGTTTVAVNQQINGGTWFKIGSALPFATGTDGFVSLSNDTGASGSVVLADAVRFLYVGPAAAPAIGAQPQSRTNNLGTDAAFAVTASGTAPLRYQWLFNGNAVGNATGSSYTRPSLQIGDAGAYSVVVSNLAGSLASSNAWLTLVPIPHIESIELQPDGTARLQISGGPGNFGVDVSAKPLNWSNLTTFTATNSVFPFIDSATNEPIRFYRVKGLP